MKNYLINLIAISILISFIGCTSNRYISQLERSLENTAIQANYSIKEINVYDRRQDISTNDFKLPFLSGPKQIIKYIPQLDSSHIAVIKSAINKYTTGTGEEININVNVVNAYKEFSSKFSSETEKVYVELQLDKIDKNDSLSVLSSAVAQYSLVSSDANYERFEQLYLLAFKGAILYSFTGLKEKEKTPFTNSHISGREK